MAAPKGNQNALGNTGGRPPKYEPDYPRRVYRLALLGLTDKEIAIALDVAESTINAWKHDYPEFLSALTRGKTEADGRVAESLFKRATGCHHKAVKIFCDTKTGKATEVPYIERYPPDPTSMIFWLKNRRPDLFRDRFHLKHTGDPNEPITIENISSLSDEELSNRARELAEKMLDLEGKRRSGKE
jgi:hypothetical protein